MSVRACEALRLAMIQENYEGKRPRGSDIIAIYEAAVVQTSPQTCLSEC